MSQQNLSDEGEQFKEQFEEELVAADFPLNNPMELSSMLSDGVVFDVGDEKITGQEIGVELSENLSYPYTTKYEFMDDVVDVLGLTL